MPEPLTGVAATAAPPAPLTYGPAPDCPRSLWRALLVSGLSLLLGAGLGVAGFLFEQSGATWRPQATATDTGWRLSTSHGLRLGSSALGGDHLAWEAGPFTLLTDLRSGKSKLLGASTSASSATAPSASDRFIVWLQTPATETRDAVIWVYDVQRSRRTRLENVPGVSRSPAVSGTTAVWEAESAGAGAAQIRGADLVSGRRFSPGESGGGGELIISGTLVAWSAARAAAAAPPVITVVDLADGRRWSVPPYSPGQGSLLGIALAGRTLVWARATSTVQAEQIFAYDLDSTAVRVIGQAADRERLRRQRAQRPGQREHRRMARRRDLAAQHLPADDEAVLMASWTARSSPHLGRFGRLVLFWVLVELWILNVADLLLTRYSLWLGFAKESNG